MKRKILFIVMLIAIIMAISCTLCMAEETETPSEETTVEIPEEVESGLREKLWFLDDAIVEIVLSAVGTFSALFIALYQIMVTLKELKNTTAVTIGTKEALDEEKEKLSKTINDLVEERDMLRGTVENCMKDIAQLKEMCLIAFTTDSNLVIDGRAEEIKKISEEN